MDIQRRYLSIASVLFILIFFLSACKPNIQKEIPGSKNTTPTNSPIIEKTEIQLRPSQSPRITIDVPLSTLDPEKTQIQPYLEVNNKLLQALSAVPEGSRYIFFINWENIKTQSGFTNVNSSSEWELRQDFFLFVFDRYPVDSAFGIMYLRNHAEQWGWDSSDLEWEVFVARDQPPGYILKFRDGFDFAPVIKHLEERGFKKSDYSGIPTYTHKIEVSQDWSRTTELSIFNTAILLNNNMMILSPNYKIMIDAYQNHVLSDGDNPSVQSIVDRLGDVDVSFISADPCILLSREAGLESLSLVPTGTEQIQTQPEDRPSLNDYESFAIGYLYENNQQEGYIIMHFADSSIAYADLPMRQKLAVEGYIQSNTPQTYADTYFSLTDSYIIDQDIIFKIQPVGETPGRIFQMVERLDMAFAACQ